MDAGAGTTGFDSMRKGQEGLTLVEMIISMAILSLVLMVFMTLGLFGITQHRRQAALMKAERELRHSVCLIERRLREMDRQQMVYLPEEKTFETVMRVPGYSLPVTVRADFSGSIRYARHTWLYFERNSGTLRVNKNGEHNVISGQIADIDVIEQIPGRLFEIQVTGVHGELPATLVFHLPGASSIEEEEP